MHRHGFTFPSILCLRKKGALNPMTITTLPRDGQTTYRNPR